VTWFEDFSVGARMRHARGKTVTDFEVATLCHLVMNTHQAHFNAQFMAATPFERPINFGGITAAIVVGLAMQDTGEHALAELALSEVRFPKPVVAGDTLYALSEVVAVDDGERDDAGRVAFRHWGVNQDDDVVFEGRREVLVMRRGHWEEQL
jgi:itaconyl-CoA hydratase